MKRLVRKAQKYTGDDFSNYDFLNFTSPTEQNESPKPEILDPTELANAFKTWFIENWIQQGKDPKELQYVGLLPEEVFVAWVYSSVSKAHLINSIIDQAKFLLKSERILR
jgi:hypothetical protein